MASVGAAAVVHHPGRLARLPSLLLSAGAAVVAASVAAAVVRCSRCLTVCALRLRSTGDAAVVDVPEEPAAVVAAAELSGATLSPGTYPSGHSVYGCGGRGLNGRRLIR